MNFTATQIADLLKGEIIGDKSVFVNKLSRIEEGEKESISFLSNEKYEKFLYTTQASIVIINKSFIPNKKTNATLIKVEDAYLAFTQLLEFYKQAKESKKGIEEPSFISKKAKIGLDNYIGAFAYVGDNVVLGDNVKIYPHVYIGENVTIKKNTTLYAGVKVYSESVIGEDCIIHSNAVIGSDGFGFAPTNEGSFTKIPQTGNVLIGDNVEIGAETVIDRATLGSTILENNVKLDNLIQIAHNVLIKENTVIAAQTGIAGSAKIGKNCMIGGQVAIAGHITIPNNTKIGAAAGIASSPKKEGLVLQGTPAMEIRDFFRSSAIFKRLPEIQKQIDSLIKKNNN